MSTKNSLYFWQKTTIKYGKVQNMKTHKHRFELPIWRILYDKNPQLATENLLFFELRDKDSVEWCTLNTHTNLLLWQRKEPISGWWTSAVSFEAGIIYLNQYDDAEQLLPKKRWIINALDGSLMETQVQKLANTTAPLNQSAWQTSVTYTEGNVYYTAISHFIHEITGRKPQNTINYGEIFGNLLSFQYFYASNAITLSRSILVVNSSKAVLFHETIDSNVESIGSEEYLYDNKNLIYLCQKDELVVLKLS